MANLITEKQKGVVRQEYLVRLSILGLFMASLLGVFLLIYIALYYISVSKTDLIVSDQLKSVIDIENKQNLGASAIRTVARTNDEIKALEIYGLNNISLTADLSKIISKKNIDIRLTRLTYNSNQKGAEQFLVSGVAKNRSSLITFVEALKSITTFASVESPVSDLTKNTDIIFTINIKTSI